MRNRFGALTVPRAVIDVLLQLRQHGHEAYLVGGCVRDMLLGTQPHDWDVTTDALPAQTESYFPRTHGVGARFGTIGVHTDVPGLVVEVTTFRTDMEYVDGRRPEAVAFSTSVTDDLARRDFTMNAIAWDPLSDEVVDPFGGGNDIEGKLIRAVGDATARFREDALRMLRAVRFSAQLGFTLDLATWTAIELEAPRVRRLSGERIRDEMLRLLTAPRAGDGVLLLDECGLLRYVLPRLQGAAHMAQGKPGAPTLLAHLAQTVDAVPPQPLLRLAALLHDSGKLTTRQVTPEGRIVFHGHETAGEDIVYEVGKQWRLSRADTKFVASLVRMHMVFGDDLGAKAVRRWVAAHGEEWVRALIALRRADHVASGGDMDANPFARRLDELLAKVIAEQSAVTLRDLAITGRQVMAITGWPPGPRIGAVLERLLQCVLDDPVLNDAATLAALVPDVAVQVASQETVQERRQNDGQPDEPPSG